MYFPGYGKLQHDLTCWKDLIKFGDYNIKI